jgi:hypothetical protein
MSVAERKPSDRLTRFDYYMELLNDWERHEMLADQRGYDGIVRNLQVAQVVLKSSILVSEVLDLEHLGTLEETTERER